MVMTETGIIEFERNSKYILKFYADPCQVLGGRLRTLTEKFQRVVVP